MHDEDVVAAEPFEHVGQRLDELTAEDAHHLVGRPGRIGQRAEHIEDRAHPELSPRTHGVLHGAVMRRREQKAHPHTHDALRNLLRAQVQTHAGGLEHVGAARATGHRTVAVLGHVGAGGGGNESAGGRDVEGVGPVAAGSAGVDEVWLGDDHLGGEPSHDRGRGRDLLDALALHAQADEKAADLRRGRLTGHDRLHYGLHLLA